MIQTSENGPVSMIYIYRRYHLYHYLAFALGDIIDIFTDFSVNSSDELQVVYEISVDREYETELFENDYETSITDSGIIHERFEITPTQNP